MEPLFLNFTLVLGLATVFAIVARLLKFPLIVAYIVAGIVLSTLGEFGSEAIVFSLLPEIGIAFLLFLIGMELDIREMLHVGKPSIIAAVVQIIISTLAGFAIARFFALGASEATYVGLALAFSSTITVVKLLTERNDENSLPGRLSIGILLVEDIVAIVLLMLLSFSGTMLSLTLPDMLQLIALTIRIVLFFSLTIYISRFILPSLFSFIAHSTELLLLSAITFCFMWIAAAQALSFSLAIGAFLAGLALASSPYRLQIAGRIKPLRDFFTILFFVSLGAQANLVQIAANIWPLITFSFYAIAIKPVIFVLVLSILGYRKHPTFLTSINLTQISEFSLIVLVAGAKLGIVALTTVATFALVAASSITVSSILITHAKWLYKWLFPLISLFERKHTIKVTARPREVEMEHHYIVVGCHRSGGKVVDYLAEKRQDKLIAVDFNPEIVKNLTSRGIRVVFGDIADPEIVAEVNLAKAKLLISTVRDFEDNHFLLTVAKKENPNIFVILSAQSESEVAKLKRRGADKVIIPEALEGTHIINFLSREYFA